MDEMMSETIDSYRYAMEAFKEERYQDALPDLRKAADLGDAEAQYRCALMYLQGMDVERNGKKASTG